LSLGDGKIIHAYGNHGVIISDDYTNIPDCTYIGWAWPSTTPPIAFEIVSCTEYKLKIKAPQIVGDHTIKVDVETTPGTESASLLISIGDTDNDGLYDYEEDKNQDGIVDPDETDQNNPDTDGDGINDKEDPYPWRTENRKALVVGITEYEYPFGFFEPEKIASYPEPQKRMANDLEKLGFKVTRFIDYDKDDGDVLTYDEVSGAVTNFANDLKSDDVAVVYVQTHGMQTFGKYWMCYGDNMYSEDAMFPFDTRHVTGQLDNIGTYLDFLWLHTCDSWAYQDEIDDLGAGGIIFFGSDGSSYVVNDQDVFYNAILAEKHVEETIDNIQAVNKNYKMDDQYSGNMDLMDPLLTHKSPIIHMPEPEGPTQTPNETFDSVNYTIWDSDGDDINDTVTVSWDANTVFLQDNVTVFAYVRNSGHEMVKQYVYGPYTIYGNSPEISSVNFYATSTDTYNIRLMLYDSSLNPVDVAFITDLSLDAGTGGPGGDEGFTTTWFDTTDSNGDGSDDTIIISWNADTTLPQEDVSVLITVRDTVLKYGPYTIYNSLPNAGEVEFYVGDIGVYEVSLYLIDSNSEFEDSAFLEVPIEVSKFTDTYADYGTDTDGDGQYDYLTIDVGIDVTSAGNYTLRGSLYHGGGPIDTVSNDLYLNEGIQTIQLNFDGQTLYKSGIDGQYELRYLVLYSNGAFIGHRDRAHTTSAYDHTQFRAPIVLFNTFDDHGVDTNSNGLFEYLRIEAKVDVATAGNYTISGYLYDSTGDFIVSASNYTYLDIGQQTVQLNFDGQAISDSGKDGAYNLAQINVYDDTLNLINSKENAYITQAYDHTQFEIRHIILDWELTTPTEVILDQSFSVGVNISNPSGRVLTNLQASLVLPSEFDTTDALTIDIGNLEPEQNKTIEWTLRGINSGYGEITINITSPDIQNVSITRGIIVTSDSLSVETDKDTYMLGDDVIINTSLTNDNPEVSYVDLVVNVTIQGPDITETYSTPIPYIGSLETENITLIWDTTGKTGGTYTVTAKVLEDSRVLNETSTSFTLQVSNLPPVANANGPYVGFIGEPITFNGAGSYDPDGTIVNYNWDLDDDGVFDDATGAIPTKTWDAPYSGNISLRVTDDNGATDIDSTTLTVKIPATIDFDPDTLNKKSEGNWVTVYTELPAGYNVTDINVSTMLLNETVPAELQPIEVGDYDSDGVPDLMVKFDRQAVNDILPIGDAVSITVTGNLYDGAPFEGSDTIRVIDKGKGK
jgi:hypothetical protein